MYVKILTKTWKDIHKIYDAFISWKINGVDMNNKICITFIYNTFSLKNDYILKCQFVDEHLRVVLCILPIFSKEKENKHCE